MGIVIGLPGSRGAAKISVDRVKTEVNSRDGDFITTYGARHYVSAGHGIQYAWVGLSPGMYYEEEFAGNLKGYIEMVLEESLGKISREVLSSSEYARLRRFPNLCKMTGIILIDRRMFAMRRGYLLFDEETNSHVLRQPYAMGTGADIAMPALQSEQDPVALSNLIFSQDQDCGTEFGRFDILTPFRSK